MLANLGYQVCREGNYIRRKLPFPVRWAEICELVWNQAAIDLLFSITHVFEIVHLSCDPVRVKVGSTLLPTANIAATV